MKHPVKKILSSMFVGCMLLSASAMVAGAVNDVPEIDLADAPILASSNFQSVSGVAYIDQEDGSTAASEFNYLAPADASPAELREIAVCAAYQKLISKHDPTERASSFDYQDLGFVRDADIYPANEGPDVTVDSDEELQFTPDFVAVSIGSPSSSLETVNVAFMNGDHRDEPYQLNFDVTQYDISVKFKRNVSYHGETAYMAAGDWVSGRVTSNNGRSGTADVGLYAVIE